MSEPYIWHLGKHSGVYIPISQELLDDFPPIDWGWLRRKNRNFMPAFNLFPRLQRALDWAAEAKARMTAAYSTLRWGVPESDDDW